MARYTVEADGRVIPFEAPGHASQEQLRTLAARALKARIPDKNFQRPILEKRLVERFTKGPKPPGEIRATPPTLANRITAMIGGALTPYFGNEAAAQRFAGKATGALQDFTPVGAATEADEARRAFSEGRVLAALGHGALAAFGAVPDAGPAAKAIIAPLWHGSPHTFERFALEKIGTGEGSQAYGHGLYFSEEPEVAKFYRPSPIWDEKRDFWQRPGALYEVGINANPSDLLDWNAPLAQQPRAVLDLIRAVQAQRIEKEGPLAYRMDQVAGPTRHGGLAEKGSGAAAYKYLSAPRYGLTEAEAARRLLDAGVPGIRYRGGGNGSRFEGAKNYVVFDPSIIDIIERHQ